ncbi:MAG TPA: ribosome-associated translation inhibitor RaiA [Candidatus Sulfotelmatobacter sp.]|nr:ribosome-associated translation inhibitor RaiA [Candidatus Sulfotelmatobacter sp.]
MQIQVSGKQIDIGDALRGHVAERLEALVGKYFDRAIEASVVFAREAHLFSADCLVHVGSGISVQSHAKAAEIHASFDAALERIDKRLRRYKRRLRNHHANRKDHGGPAEQAPAYVLAAEPDSHDEEPAELKPVIVAESMTAIEVLSVGEAVMRLDLTEQPALMFRNRAHGGLNVIYRRADGNIGWIDPERADR